VGVEKGGGWRIERVKEMTFSKVLKFTKIKTKSSF